MTGCAPPGLVELWAWPPPFDRPTGACVPPERGSSLVARIRCGGTAGNRWPRPSAITFRSGSPSHWCSVSAAWFWLPDKAAGVLSVAGNRGHPWCRCLVWMSRLGRALAIFAFTAAFGLALIWWKSNGSRSAPGAAEVVDFVAGSIGSRLSQPRTVRLVVAPRREGLPAFSGSIR